MCWILVCIPQPEFDGCCEVLHRGSTTLLASVHWLLLSLLFSKLGWNLTATATSVPPGIGGLAASLLPPCAPFALGPTKPGNAHRQGAPKLHLKVGGVNRPTQAMTGGFPLLDWLFTAFTPFFYSIDFMLYCCFTICDAVAACYYLSI